MTVDEQREWRHKCTDNTVTGIAAILVVVGINFLWWGLSDCAPGTHHEVVDEWVGVPIAQCVP